MKKTIKKTVLLLSAACLVCLAVTGCGGKSAWSTLDQETAEAIDADFRGKVWKLEDGELYAAKCKVKVQEDGSINSSSPSSNAPLKDSDLIPVIYTEDTKFYVRNISGDGGESVDTEGSFEDLELHMTIDMKGEFGDDGFHPSEIRMLRFS
ncbi:MAG: hypothetical protein HFI19_09385 [Lachnospiraceae bacterium]|uniref:hypothetical protein n=1 Tax=Candidatus Merdisoma sp. JLR.KK006 TaxID=3112626 RepID=UPI002FF01185|nr:hypothetical protein [Lachnospiraceae bacterium]